jgi:hypothetical protein
MQSHVSTKYCSSWMDASLRISKLVHQKEALAFAEAEKEARM